MPSNFSMPNKRQRAITAEASLSFLGLGSDPTLPTQGGMLRAGGPNRASIRI
jgi:ABC-type dipeptide/oligopeptide/nickel transport system permease subunit